MKKLRILELFGGIGACSKALERLGIDYEIADYVEIDKYAVKSFNAIHGTSFEPQDICKWDKDINVDLIMHGSPCQDFSLAGKQAGGDKGSGTRSSLMYETIRIVEKLKPKYVVWENVKNLLSSKHRHNFDAYLETMENLGYTNYYQVMNAKDYGIPQNRERVFTVSIRNEYVLRGTFWHGIDDNDYEPYFDFPPKQELKLKLKDMLEDEVNEKYYLSDKAVNGLINQMSRQHKPCIIDIDKEIDKPFSTITAGYYKQGHYETFLKIKNATKQGYLEATDGDGVYISNIDKKRGTVQKEMIPTLKTSPDIGVVVDDKTGIDITWNEVGDTTDVARTLTTACRTLSKNQMTTGILENNLRIRKLTPKECWRLMGFNDEDFEKAEKVNSNTQLYKQAGNSIVVNVLQAIFRNLLSDYMWSDLD